jgi:hypothetical protein
LEQVAERLEREAQGSSLESVNRIRRLLFGMLPEDAQTLSASRKPCPRNMNYATPHPTLSPNEAERVTPL